MADEIIAEITDELADQEPGTLILFFPTGLTAPRGPYPTDEWTVIYAG